MEIKFESFKKLVLNFCVNSYEIFIKNTFLSCNTFLSFKTEFARGPGRSDTCHLSNLEETLAD